MLRLSLQRLMLFGLFVSTFLGVMPGKPHAASPTDPAVSVPISTASSESGAAIVSDRSGAREYLGGKLRAIEHFDFGMHARSNTAIPAQINSPGDVYYSNLDHPTGGVVLQGPAATVSGNGITRLVADDITGVSPGASISELTFSVANQNAVTVSCRARLRFWSADGAGGAPGTYLGSIGLTFPAFPFPPGVTIASGGLPVGVFPMPASKFWAGIAFDNENGTTGATLTQLGNIGQGLYDPPSLGSSADLLFETTSAGSFLGVNNPTGARVDQSGGPKVSAGWKFSDVPISGTVSAQIHAEPDTASTLRGLPDVQVEIVRTGPSHFTRPSGEFSWFEEYRATDIVRATLSSSMNEGTSCAGTVSDACGDACLASAADFDEAAPGATPPIDLEWPLSNPDVSEAVHAFYFAEKVGRDYWTDIIGLAPNDHWKVVVGDGTKGVKSQGGGYASPCKKEIHFRTGYAYYPSVIYHEFAHRMIEQLVGNNLRGQDGAIDEGFADYFATSFANQSKIYTPDIITGTFPSVRRDLDPPNNLPQFQTCSGADARGFNTRVFGCTLWDLRKRLIGRGRASAEIDRWIWGAIAPFAARITEPTNRTFLEFYHQLRNYTAWGSTYEPELMSAFAKFNIQDVSSPVCYPLPVIHGVDRVINTGRLYATATWGTVPASTGYNVYVRRGGGAILGLDLGMLVAQSIPDTFYTYADDDTATTVAFLVTAIDSSGAEGPESQETPLVTGVPAGIHSAVQQSLRAWPNPSRGMIHLALATSQVPVAADVYDLNGRVVRTLGRGHRLAQAFDWDGRDNTGHRVLSGIYFVRVRLDAGTLYRRVILLD